MTDIIECAEAALVGTTDGPWVVNREGWACISSGSDSVFHGYFEGSCPACGDEINDEARVAISIEDAEFIAWARGGVPELLAELKEARAAQHYVMQKYAGNGWYGFPPDRPLFPLGSGRNGQTVALLWRGGDEARPGVVVELPELSLLICRGCMRYMDYCVKDPCDERADLLAAAAPAVRPGDNIYASNQAQADAVNRFIETGE